MAVLPFEPESIDLDRLGAFLQYSSDNWLMARQQRHKQLTNVDDTTPHGNTIIRPVEGGIEITIKAVPGASRDRLAGVLGDALKIQVAAPPEKGKANAALAGLIASALGVSIKAVEVVRGHGAPRKTVRVLGVDAETARARLGVT